MAEPASPDRPAAPPQKSQAELEAEIAETRERLATTLEELRVQTQPANLARHGLETVKGFFTDEFGGVRPDRVAMAAGLVIGVVMLGKWRSVRRARRCHCH